MAQDVKLEQNAAGTFDLVVADQVLDGVDGFETSIIASLLTDARASSANVQIPSRRRGWLGNIITADTGRQLGSQLWLYHQARLTPSIVNDIAVAAQEALFWMVEDGIAKTVVAAAEQTGLRKVTILISITTPQGTETEYSLLWRQTDAI